MSGWDGYRAVYGVELRAATHEFDDHGWPVVQQTASTLLLITGRVLDVLEVPVATGRQMCVKLREAGYVAPVAATDSGTWWFPVSAGAELPAVLAATAGVVLHGPGDAVLAPPSLVPDGQVHWRVPPALVGYRVPPSDVVLHVAVVVHAAVGTVRQNADHGSRRPGAQRPGGAVVAMRS
jgi:hypothetical protein